MKKTYSVVMLLAVFVSLTLLLGKTARVAAAAPAGIKNVVLVHGAFADEEARGDLAIAQAAGRQLLPRFTSLPPADLRLRDGRNRMLLTPRHLLLPQTHDLGLR